MRLGGRQILAFATTSKTIEYSVVDTRSVDSIAAKGEVQTSHTHTVLSAGTRKQVSLTVDVSSNRANVFRYVQATVVVRSGKLASLPLRPAKANPLPPDSWTKQASE